MLKTTLAALAVVLSVGIAAPTEAQRQPPAKCKVLTTDSVLQSWTYQIGVTAETRYRWETTVVQRCRGQRETTVRVTMWYLADDLPPKP